MVSIPSVFRLGEIIPKADPWVHFGDASNTIEMQLDPGVRTRSRYRRGDDEHRTVNGLCETITIRIDEGSSTGWYGERVR